MFANFRNRGRSRPTLTTDARGNLSARLVKRPTLRKRIVDAVLWPVNREASEFFGAALWLVSLMVSSIALGVLMAGAWGVK